MAWQPGESGNPAGKKPGTGTVAALRASIAEHVPAIVTKLVDQARGGDVGASRLLLERVLPPVKAIEQEAPISLPRGTLTDQGRAVMAAAATGELTPTQAAQLLAGLSALAKLVETDDLVKRVQALEGRMPGIA
jgi:hypothetical protein